MRGIWPIFETKNQSVSQRLCTQLIYPDIRKTLVWVCIGTGIPHSIVVHDLSTCH